MACPPGLRSRGNRVRRQGRARDGDARATGPAPTVAVHTVRGQQGAIGPKGAPLRVGPRGRCPDRPPGAAEPTANRHGTAQSPRPP